MDDQPPRTPLPEDPVMRFLEEWVWPYFEEATLWPVLFALLAHLSVLVAILLIQAWRSQAPWAWAGIVFLGLMTVDIARREWAFRRRPGRVTVVVTSVWLAGAGLGAFTGFYGIF